MTLIRVDGKQSQRDRKKTKTSHTLENLENLSEWKSKGNVTQRPMSSYIFQR